MRRKPAPKGGVVVRDQPIWRRFRAGDAEAAHRHASKGGIAVWSCDDHPGLLLPRTRGGELAELAHWALLALGVERWVDARPGIAAARLGPEAEDTVAGFCARDQDREGHVERVELDCLACGACCRQSRVVVQPADRTAFRRAGRSELEASLKTDKGESVLRRAPSGACIHFGAGNRCMIYELRPHNCRAFPVASEPCLFARSRMANGEPFAKVTRRPT
jgi:Fe-S-cluster containining protein